MTKLKYDKPGKNYIIKFCSYLSNLRFLRYLYVDLWWKNIKEIYYLLNTEKNINYKIIHEQVLDTLNIDRY